MDDTTKKGPPDSSRINVNESWEVQYWCNSLGVSKDELKAAVQEVGTWAADVRRHFQGQTPAPEANPFPEKQ